MKVKKKTVNLDTLPDEIQSHIASYLDTKSLCFFAKASKCSLKNALTNLMKRQQSLLAEVRIDANACISICYTSRMLYVCGDSEFGQLGLGHFGDCRNIFTRIENLPGTILQVVAGYRRTFVLTNQGLYACGSNEHGQLGLGHNFDDLSYPGSFSRIEGILGTILEVIAGNNHNLVLTNQGLYACGFNQVGQLGLGHNRDCNSFFKVENLPGTISQVAAGLDLTLVLTDQGLYACGNNQHGQLGLGHNNSCNSFVKVDNHQLGTILQMAVGFNYTFLLTDQGLYVCGYNGSSQLGLGHTNPCHQLTKVEISGTIFRVVVGSSHTFMLTDQGLYACGYNGHSQLGLGHNNHCRQLTKLENLPGTVLQVIAGNYHTLVLTNQGLYVCGYNKYGQLGLGHNDNCNRFSKVENLTGTILKIAAGSYHSLVLTDQGLYACGYNEFGQLGVGHNNNCNSFTKVNSLPSEIEQLFSLYRYINNLIRLSRQTNNHEEHLIHSPDSKKPKIS